MDHVPARLEKAKSIGAIPINFAECDPVKEILKHEPEGVDRSCECVGYECVDAKGKNVENLTIKWAVAVTRPYGGIGLIGVYAPADIGICTPCEIIFAQSNTCQTQKTETAFSHSLLANSFLSHYPYVQVSSTPVASKTHYFE